MNKEQARITVELMLRHGKELNELLTALQESGLQGDALTGVKRPVGRIMGSMLLDIMNPIFDVYPELKPKGLE